MKSTKIEAEGGELVLQSKEGHFAITPSKDRAKVLKMIKEGCDDCINNYIQTLPKHSDYAEDGSLLLGNNSIKEKIDNAKNFIKNKFKGGQKNAPIDENRGYLDNPDLLVNQKRYTQDELETLKDTPYTMSESDKLNLKNIGYTNTKADDVNNSSINMMVPLKEIEVTDFKPLFNKNDSNAVIKEKQKKLLESGAYENKLIDYDSEKEYSKEEARTIQQQLKDNGYELPKSTLKTKELDGIIGPETSNAINDYNKKLYNKEVDGIIGDRTKNAELAFNKTRNIVKKDNLNFIDQDIEKTLIKKGLKNPNDINESSINNPITQTITKEVKHEPEVFNYNGLYIKGDINGCTRYVSKSLKKYGISNSDGSRILTKGAWTLLKDGILPKQYKLGYDLFSEKPKIDISHSLKQNNTNINKYVISHIKKDKEKRKSLKDIPPLSVVNIFYTDSKFRVQAYNESNTTLGTHAGFVVVKDGKKYIEHEVSGSKVLTPLQDMINGTGKGKGKHMYIIAVKENTDFKKGTIKENTTIKYFNDEMDLDSTHGDLIGSKEGNIVYAKTKDYGQQLGSMFNLDNHNINNLSKAALLIITQESAFNKKKSLDQGLKGIGKDLVDGRYVPILNPDSKERSRGYGQVKDAENYSPELRKKLNINNETLDDRSQKGLNTSIKATEVKLLKNYQQLTKAVKDNNIKINNNDIWKLAIQGYNFNIEGLTNSLIKYKTYDAIQKAYKDEAEKAGKKYKAYPPVYNFNAIKIK